MRPWSPIDLAPTTRSAPVNSAGINEFSGYCLLRRAEWHTCGHPPREIGRAHGRAITFRHLAEVSPFGRVLFTSRSAVVNRALRGEAVLMLASPSRSPRYSRLSSGVDGRAAPWTGDFMAIERYVENLVSISAKEPPPEKILPTRILDAPRLEVRGAGRVGG